MANKICPETSTTSFSSSPYISLSRESFTIWMKSLVFNGNGCTAYNSKGEISFRIDNYQERCRNREIYLMDPNGKVLFSIQKEKIPFIGKWNIYKWSDTNSCKGGPWFRVKKNYKASQKNCQVCIGWDNSNISCYKIIETTSDKLAYKIVDSQNHHVAEVKRKQSSNGVDLGDDVLSLMVEPQKDYSFIVALVAVRGLISESQNSFGVHIKGREQTAVTYFKSEPSLERSKNEEYLNYRVSHRKNPGGSNPLHN
ncbi:hypothetical protein Leryth_001679 [Lithospermum erythrorhizon]|nr:hypothetical protein Leryth_001679 [Lithospermum erythrorhizon]